MNTVTLNNGRKQTNTHTRHIQKLCIQETLNLPACAGSSPNTVKYKKKIRGGNAMCHLSLGTCHLSPVTCLALPTCQAMLVKTAFLLKPLEAKGGLHICFAEGGTDNTQTTEGKQTDNR